MTAIETVLSTLDTEFAPFDAKVLANSQAWAAARAAEVREWEASDEAKTLRRNVWAFYAKAHAIAGGKTWYAVVRDTPARREAFVVRNCAAVAKSRNARIAKKLIAADVTEVTTVEVSRTRDGFNGFFVVATPNGSKRVTVETIVAGGYNIQCLHLRVLVNIT